MPFKNYFQRLMCELIPRPTGVISSNPPTNIQSRQKIKATNIVNPQGFRSKDKIRALTTNFNNKISVASINLTTKERFFRDMRGIFNCGDEYAQCNQDADCGSNRFTCYQNQCTPNINNCAVKGCGEFQSCDIESGECESTRRICENDEECGTEQECIEGECFIKETYCRNDVDCSGRKDIEEKPIPKCNTEDHTCKVCNFGEPSPCVTIDPTKPNCWEHQCFPICTDPNNQGTEPECCTPLRIFDPRLPSQVEGCCKDRSDYYSKIWTLGAQSTKCCLDESNSGVGTGRMCTNWAGKSGDLACCGIKSCDINISSPTYGQCKT